MNEERHLAAPPYKVLVIDDHPIIQAGFTQLLNHQPDLAACGVAASFNEALEQIDQTHPDLLLVDISLKDGNGLDLIRTVRSRDPEAKILVVSMYEDTLYAERVLSAGALGYINKQEDTSRLLAAIRATLQGKVYLAEPLKERILQRARGSSEPVEESPVERLSDRELEVFELIGNGSTTAEIADRLCLSVHTINTHRQRIKAKLQLANAAELAQAAAQWMFESGSHSDPTHHEPT